MKYNIWYPKWLLISLTILFFTACGGGGSIEETIDNLSNSNLPTNSNTMNDSTVDPVPEPTVDPIPVPEPTVDPIPVPEPMVDPIPVPEPTVDPIPVPEPTVDPIPVPEPMVDPIPVPEPTAPTISLIGDKNITIKVGESYTEQGATAYDILDADISSKIVCGTGGYYDMGGGYIYFWEDGSYMIGMSEGVYTVTCAIVNSQGLISSVDRTVNVVADTPTPNPIPSPIAPTISLIGDSSITMKLGKSYIEQGAIASDSVEGDITSKIVCGTGEYYNYSGYIYFMYDTSYYLGDYEGVYTVTCAVSNSNGMVSDVNRTVNVVVDTPVPNPTAPTITLIGDKNITITLGTSYSEKGATAYDSLEGNISANVICGIGRYYDYISYVYFWEDTIDTLGMNEGVYTVTCVVKNSQGLSGSVDRTVNVVADSPVNDEKIDLSINRLVNSQITIDVSAGDKVTTTLYYKNLTHSTAKNVVVKDYYTDRVFDSSSFILESVPNGVTCINTIEEDADGIPLSLIRCELSNDLLYKNEADVISYSLNIKDNVFSGIDFMDAIILSYSDDGNVDDYSNSNISENVIHILDSSIDNKPPVANAGSDKTVEVNKAITLTGSGTDSDGAVVSYSWKKGTTILSNSASFSYTPTTTGTHTLTLIVTDNEGETATDTMIVTVTATPNKAPTANAGSDKTVEVNKGVYIIGSGSDSDGTISSYKWTENGVTKSYSSSFTYTPTTTGTHTLTLTVTDNDGATHSDTMIVTVTATPNKAPTANAGSDTTVEVNKGIYISGSGSDSDGTISSYKWTENGVNKSSSSSFTYTPTTTGTHTLTLTVTDNDGATHSDTMRVTATATPNKVPTANAGSDKTVVVNTPITLVGSGTDTDGFIQAYEWRVNGYLQSISSTFTYTPNTVGTYTLTLTVYDNDMLADSDSVNIVVTTSNIELPTF